jgi:long-chain acyl-CoA synthetase
VRRGDRVGVMVPNTADFPTVYYGVLFLGATVVPIHLLLSSDEIAYILRDTEARVLVADAEVISTAAPAAAATGTPMCTVGEAGDGATHTTADHLIARTPGDQPAEEIATVEPEDVAVILYTSGTTGAPKGAMLTHANLLWNAVVSARDVVSLSERDRIFGSVPLFHSNGQTVVMNAAMCAGAAVVLMRRFDGRQALELIEREHVSVFVGVPTMYAALLAAASSDRRRPQLRLAVSGAAPLPTTLIEQFQAVFGTEIFEGYGLTEASPVVTFSQPVFGRRAGSIGHAIWGLDVEIARADVEGRIELIASGEVGEVVVRGHAVFAGYLNNPVATAAAINDGWLRTGDLGTKDDEGFLRIVGRKKEMILRGGYNVYPQEVEEVMAGHPDIALVAVVGGPDPYYGEEVHAFVVLRGKSESSSGAEIVEWAKARLARYKYPRHVHIRDSLPLGPSGKIMKKELAEGLARATR